MRIDLETIQKIELYLSGSMTPAEKAEFEIQIDNDPELKNAVEAQHNLIRGMEKLYIKNAAVKAGTKVRLYSFLKKGGIVLAVAVIIIASVIGYNKFMNRSSNSSDSNTSENIVIPDIKKGEAYDPGKFIPSQYFEIDGNRDTVIVGNNGVMFAIPAGSFVDENNNRIDGKIKFELKEALDPSTIILSGLSTFSDDKPLETGGMFYINATHKGKELKIAEGGILTSVPQADSKPGMMMFDGVVGPDGDINWVNPKEIESFLLPVDIRALDFYPPGYYNKLKELETGSNLPQATTISNTPNDSFKLDTGYSPGHSDYHAQTTMDVLEKGNSTFNYESKKYRDSVYLSFESDVRNAGGLFAIDPKSGYIAVIDKYNNKIYETIDTSLFNLPNFMEILVNRFGFNKGILPSNILAFWRPEFNNTYLATREFESRMPLIHQTCNNAILDLYINNLDKKLYQVDSMAANIAGGLAPEFLKFASYRHGNVAATDKKLKMLQVFYQNQAYSYAITAINVTRKFFENNRKADLMAYQNSMQQLDRDTKNQQKQIEEEYNLNLNEAYRQLGKKRPRIGASNVTATLTTTGWKNVDMYVAESVVARTTLDYTDTNGKKAIIKYIEMNVSISNQNEFEMINVYLIPDKLNAYMKVNYKDGKYTESLNELLTYDLLAVGYKSGNVFYQLKEDILPSQYTLTLNPGDLKEISYMLNNLRNHGSNVELKKTLEYSMFQLADADRKRSFNKVMMDREQLKCVIFPCAEFVNEASATDSVEVSIK